MTANAGAGVAPNELFAERHSAAYAEWLVDHPGGYVLNLSTVTIHRANCSSVRAFITPARRPGASSDVFCALNIALLEYSMLQFEGAVYRCARCQPVSDPGGVGQISQYVANLRAKTRRGASDSPLPG